MTDPRPFALHEPDMTNNLLGGIPSIEKNYPTIYFPITKKVAIIGSYVKPEIVGFCKKEFTAHFNSIMMCYAYKYIYAPCDMFYYMNSEEAICTGSQLFAKPNNQIHK